MSSGVNPLGSFFPSFDLRSKPAGMFGYQEGTSRHTSMYLDIRIFIGETMWNMGLLLQPKINRYVNVLVTSSFVLAFCPRNTRTRENGAERGSSKERSKLRKVSPASMGCEVGELRVRGCSCFLVRSPTPEFQ